LGGGRHPFVLKKGGKGKGCRKLGSGGGIKKTFHFWENKRGKYGGRGDRRSHLRNKTEKG